MRQARRPARQHTKERDHTPVRTTAVSHYPKIPNRPRPARLRAAIGKLDRGQITPEEFARVQDEVTAEVIAEQIEAGLDVVTDGAIRWDDELTYFAGRLDGFEIGGLIRYFDTNTYYRQPNVSGPVGWREPILVRDYEFAAAASARPVKAVLTGPYTLAALSTDSHYNDRRRLVLDLAEALRNEVQALAAAGAPIIQVNEPAAVKEKGDAALVAEALTKLIDGVQAETAVYTWFGDAAGLLPALLDTPVDVIGLDFRMGPGNWDAVKAAKFDKGLGFGIVDARNTKMESAQEIADAIKRVSELVPPERLYVNPSAGLEYLPREVAFDKLKRMVEGARLAEPVTA
jgi:5-methyltetrahydropteroyltriglutamate--homocysteine methyltransferase